MGFAHSGETLFSHNEITADARHGDGSPGRPQRAGSGRRVRSKSVHNDWQVRWRHAAWCPGRAVRASCRSVTAEDRANCRPHSDRAHSAQKTADQKKPAHARGCACWCAAALRARAEDRPSRCRTRWASCVAYRMAAFAEVVMDDNLVKQLRDRPGCDIHHLPDA